MKRQQAGFTLIELVVVIIILGILAAVALPKFMGLSTDARVSVVDGLNGSVAEAADMVHALAEVNDATSAKGSVTLSDGTAITTTYGYPSGLTTGILAALQDSAAAPTQSFPFTFVAGAATATTTGTFEYTPPNGTANTGCEVVYTVTAPTAPATAATVSVVATTSGC